MQPLQVICRCPAMLLRHPVGMRDCREETNYVYGNISKILMNYHVGTHVIFADKNELFRKKYFNAV